MMEGALEVARPLTRWQRFLARFLPWYDPDAQDRRIQRTDALVAQVPQIKVAMRERLRADYRAQDDFMAGRRG